jgi:flagellar operon protein
MDTKGLGLSQDLISGGRIDSIRSRFPERPATQPKGTDKAKPFSELLEERIQGQKPGVENQSLKFSAHAQTRLESRGIDLNAEDLVKLQDAVNRARDKGAKDSLILTDKAAFIVSVKNQTVITAVDRDSLKENVFTNIDSTIMI